MHIDAHFVENMAIVWRPWRVRHRNGILGFETDFLTLRGAGQYSKKNSFSLQVTCPADGDNIERIEYSSILCERLSRSERSGEACAAVWKKRRGLCSRMEEAERPVQQAERNGEVCASG